MVSNDKVIITCAVTGSAHTPSMSPHLPFRPEDIACQAIDAGKAGAAIVHFHARDPDNGRPTSKAEVYKEVIDRVRSKSDVVINITTSGANASIEQRIAGALALRPELASLNMGSLSPMGRGSMGDRIKDFRFDWEKEFFVVNKDRVYSNTEAMIEKIITDIGAVGTRFECECYDVGHLYNVAYFASKGLLKPPFIIQTVFGFSSGIGLDPVNLTHMRTVADQLFGDQWHWSVLAPGRHQFRLSTMGATMGSNVRVGMEDNLYVTRGRLAKNNAEQVAHMKGILEMLSIEVATPDEARAQLGLRKYSLQESQRLAK